MKLSESFRGLLSRFHAARKAWSTGLDWINSDLPGNRMSTTRRSPAWVGGTGIDWGRLAGDLWTCPAVQATISWKWRQWPQAPAIMQQRKSDGSTEILATHPLLDMLRQPNPFYDGMILMQGVILDLDTRGEAFVLIERTRGRQVGELHYLPWISVGIVSQPDNPWIIDHYTFTDGRRLIEVPIEDIIHYRFGINPHDPRRGISPLISGERDVYALQKDSSYRANILRNFGVAGVFITAKDNNVDFEPKEIGDLYRQKTTGDNVGDAFVSDVPLDVTFPNVTPQSMALDTISDRPESDISALLGIPSQVVGLHVGRLAKTYANAQQAKEAAWEEGMMPLGLLIANQTWYRLGPEFNPKDYRSLQLAFDYRNVRALQPDLDALYRRANDAWKLNAISLAEWKRMVGMQPADGDDTTYYRDVGGGAQLPDSIPSQVQGDVPVKAIRVLRDGPASGNGNGHLPNWSERVAAEIEAIHRMSA